MRTTPFSLNIDESTSNSDKRVLAMLASFYCCKRKMVVVEHLASLKVICVDAKSLLSEMKLFFTENNIPWNNCVSILMDSCNVMRGSKGGLETKLRSEVAPQLLDVDGDSCHHIHNACKKFCEPFDRWVEHLQSDLHNDMKWSPDLKQYFEEICFVMGIKYTMPERFLNHRWLSCYDAVIHNSMMTDALKVFYYAFLSKEDRMLYREPIRKLVTDHQSTARGMARVKQIWDELSSKKLTDDGRRRKRRIADKLIIRSMQTLLISNFFMSVLPMLKEYVCVLQSQEPLIHVLHDKQEQIFRDFLLCFVKPEQIVSLSARQLKSFNLDSDEGQFLSEDAMFVGNKVRDLIKSAHKEDKVISDFKKCASAAFFMCAKHMQKTLPLDNSLLRSMSAIDPEARGHSKTAKSLMTLGDHLTHFLTEEQKESLPLEIHRYQVDKTLPEPKVGDRVDDWWMAIIQGEKYPALCQMAVTCLSCFHGPMVESSFNTMGDVIDIRSTRMRITTYSAMQTVRYGLRSRQTSALQYFKKGNIRHDRVDGHLTSNMKNAAGCYIKEKAAHQKAKLEKQKLVQDKQEVAASRAAQKQDQGKAAKVARLAHQRAQKRKITPALEALSLKRKKTSN